MSGIRIELANPGEYASPKDYIERHLIPVTTELHRLVSETLAPGTTAEECAVDMIPSNAPHGAWGTFDQRLVDTPKHVDFDGTEHLTFSKELLRSKQLKVQLTVVAYIGAGDSAQFRLVEQSGTVITNSGFTVCGAVPTTICIALPFSEHDGCIQPRKRRYMLQAKPNQRYCTPVCRRFSLSFILI